MSEGHEQDDNARYWEMINRFYTTTFSVRSPMPTGSASRTVSGSGAGRRSSTPRATIAKARYYEPDLAIADDRPKVARRRRIAAPLLRDEDLDLTINELLRIRGRATRLDAKGEVAVLKSVAGRARRVKR